MIKLAKTGRAKILTGNQICSPRAKYVHEITGGCENGRFQSLLIMNTIPVC